MQRALTSLIATLAATFAFSQAAAPAFDAVKWSFQALGQYSSIRVRVTGSETLGNVSTPVAGELYWWLSDVSTRTAVAKVEFTEYRNGVLTQRAVGNGKQFYNYNPQKNEYWVTSYGTFAPEQPQRYLANLVDDFTSATKGSTTYLARLLRESYAVGGFRAWVPGGSESLVSALNQTVADPVLPNRTYTATDTVRYAMFWIGSPARKSIVFELTSDANGTYTPSRIYFAERSVLGGKSRLVEWVAEVFTEVIPAAENFVFIPPAGSRPIVGPRPNIG